MKKELFRASDRGHADHGWLDTSHTFSFASYHNPNRVHFGALRVLNDDFVKGGEGFGKHPHDNMEIVSIPLSGDLAHTDSTGNEKLIRTGDVQIMSAGSGLMHSEYNGSDTDTVNFLQIWIFPKERDIKPRYEQLTFDKSQRKDAWQRVVSPNPDDKAVWINQDSVFHLADLSKGKKLTYTFEFADSGVFIMVLSGAVTVGGQDLQKRDAIGIWETDQVELVAQEDAELLAIEVPMHI